MYSAASATQRLAGLIALGEIGAPETIPPLLKSLIPNPATEIEGYVLDGLIARAVREAVRRADYIQVCRQTPLAILAAETLHSRFAEAWTIPRLARALGTNRFRLTSAFRAQFGMGIHRFLTIVRIEAARERLMRRTDKIDAIAREVGFGSRKSLYDAHYRVTGQPLKFVRASRE